MIKNYLLVAWRNLWRKKSFSILNITGLSIGMAAAVLILLWIQSEMRYDQGYANKERIYDVWNRFKKNGEINCWRTTPKVMASAIQADYPEVEQTTRVNYPTSVLFSLGDKRITARTCAVDSTFLNIFELPLLEGNRAKALDGLYSLVVTQDLAKRLFGDENPMGKVVKLNNEHNFTVTGVLKEKPRNSRFNFECLVSWAYLRFMGEDDSFWGNNSTSTYVKLKKNASFDAMQAKILTLRKKYDKEDPDMETFLYPVTRTYLHGRFENGKEAGGRIEIVRLFGIIAGFILLVACINFMNLSTARSEKRAKEVGIRKVVGARRRSLIAQFLGESVLMSLLAAVVAVLIVQLALPAFNKLVDRQLALEWNNGKFWLGALVFVIATGLLAGSYPALFLSSFKPVSVMKGTFKAANALITPRKVLVIGQFTFAIVLIIATIIVRQQMYNAQQRQTGYDKGNLIYTFMEGDMYKNYEVIKQEVLSSGAVTSITKTSAPITESWSNTWGMYWNGKDPDDKRVVNRLCADNAIVKTIGLQLVQGRDFDLTTYPTDSNATILNESAVKLMGLKDPLGQIIKDMGEEFKVIGVVKDFIVESPYQPVNPMAIHGAKGYFNVINLKLNPAHTNTANISKIEAIFKKHNPEYPYNYRFTDEEYSHKFDNEKRTGTLATLFALLTIVISCLGLFGLASYMAENRIKEIGVRKVLGASVGSITRLLSVDFLKLILVSFVIAAPLGYWAMHNWLKDFPYRVPIQWWVFAAAGLLSVGIALLTVSFQALRAARSNPMNSLRTE
ncbi:MAG: FtsX-like permease family protein [Chitinophagaceae bacterium]|nr:FtsX-like permease family protein [Chitinophagaceae bacterium]